MKKYLLYLLFVIACHFCLAQKGQQADFDKLPIVQWKFKIKQPFFSSPIINEGTVYVAGLDSTLYALELTTGNVKWKLKTNGEIRSTVVIEGSRIYLLGGNGVLSCIDKNTGKPIWRSVFDNTALFLAERRYDFADYFHSSPVVHDGILYFGTGNGRFNAVSADNGEIVWSFKAGDIIHNTPVIIKENVYFGSFDGFVYALNIRTGQIVWKFKSVGQHYFPNGEMQGSPSMGYGTLFIGGRDYNLYAIDANGGYANWNRKFQGGWALSTTVEDTVLYVGTSDDRLLLAFDARNGQELWKTNVKFNIFGGCAFTSGMVYVGSIWGKLFGVDKKTGTIKWAFATDGYTSNHLKYFKADDTYRDDIGTILRSPIEWIGAEYRMGGIFSTPSISGNSMVFSSTEGVVYCLRRS